MPFLIPNISKPKHGSIAIHRTLNPSGMPDVIKYINIANISTAKRTSAAFAAYPLNRYKKRSIIQAMANPRVTQVNVP
ncbi:MAG: hypothetical protein UFA98_01525 [Ruminococcus sp.]|nr:hypothetical protein [Ruminococcus sp.]